MNYCSTFAFQKTRVAEVHDLLSRIRKVISARDDSLFTEFLPKGYEKTTLSSVSSDDFEKVLMAKLRIGILITIYDDYADNPSMQDPVLLKRLYDIPFKDTGCESPHPVVQLVRSLWEEVLMTLETLPNYGIFSEIFKFDVEQFYNANRYSQLITANTHLANRTENRVYISHNMGMIIVGMMDLMASSDVIPSELGRIRGFLYKAQEIGRISNVLATTHREIHENDYTGEILSRFLEMGIQTVPTSVVLESLFKSLEKEREEIFQELAIEYSDICTFSVNSYLKGLRFLQALHEQMQEVI